MAEWNSDVDDLTLSQVLDEVETCTGLEELTLTQTVKLYEVAGEDRSDIGDFIISDNGDFGLPEMKEIQANGDAMRFAEISDGRIDELLQGAVNKNTQKSTRWAHSVFTAWRTQKICADAIIPELEMMSVVDINMWLSKFAVETRRQDGKQYPSRTLWMLMCGLLRYLRDRNVHEMNFLNEKDHRFVHFRRVLDAQMKKLTSDGIGATVKQAEPLTKEDESRLWECGVLGTSTSQSLLYTVFLYNCKLFGLRGCDEHRGLVPGQFSVGRDHIGQYVEFTGRSSKTFKGGLDQTHIKAKTVKHYDMQDGDRSIVNIFARYLEAIGAESDHFYKRPLTDGKFSRQPLGVNTLSGLMREMCNKGELVGQFSNHSGKRTCATQLYQAGISEDLIMDRTGHRSVKGVRAYKRPCDEMLKDVSNVLAPPNKAPKPDDGATSSTSTSSTASIHSGRTVAMPWLGLSGAANSGIVFNFNF
jgi:integrase